MAESRPSVFHVLRGSKQKPSTKSSKYLSFFHKDKEQKEKDKEQKEKKGEEKEMVNHFYDLVTDFYEYGWSDSFHFAVIQKGDSFKESLVKHELYLAMKLALRPGEHILDLGCGIGGPARNIANFSKAHITGINNNEYQISRARILTEKARLSELCSFKKGDFTKLDEPSNSVDKVFACESVCHALVKSEVFSEIYRVLKPGGLFANYDWVLTDKYDPENSEHKKIADDIREGNGLPVFQTTTESVHDLKAVGFEILEAEDLALTSPVPWESPLEPGIFNFKATPVGRMATHSMLFCLEKMGMTPKGSTKVHDTLCMAADALVKGAKLGIFTAMYFHLAKKPE